MLHAVYEPSILKSVLYLRLHSSKLSTVTSPVVPCVPLQLAAAADNASSAVVLSSGEISDAILKALARGESGWLGSVWVTSISARATLGRGKKCKGLCGPLARSERASAC